VGKARKARVEFEEAPNWAVMHVTPGAQTWRPSSLTFPREVVRAGFFDEAWKTTP
jgi:hypothetical protein